MAVLIDFLALRLLSDRRLPERLLSDRRLPDLHRDIHISRPDHRDMVGITVDVYAKVGIDVNSEYRRSDNRRSDKRRSA